MAAILLALACAPSDSPAWTTDEHRVLADSALGTVLVNLGAADSMRVRQTLQRAEPGTASSALDALGFGAVAARSARNEHSPARYHPRYRSLLEELEGLTAARLDSAWSEEARPKPGGLVAGPGHGGQNPGRLRARNVAVGYLEQHVIALRFARRAGEQQAFAAGANASGNTSRHDDAATLLRAALIHEAFAQGFLADAFASRHLMPPMGFRLAALHPVNRSRYEDYYSNQGLYVLNARGEAWQTFGDKLLLWYGPSFAHVFEACTTSLHELLLTWTVAAGGEPRGSLAAWADSIARERGTTPANMVDAWCAGHEGPAYFAEVRMPTLMLIPAPVVATWSVRTDQAGGHGLMRRHQYPQLSDPGGHDPTLDAADIALLRGRRAVPEWMTPDSLFHADPLTLIRRHPDFASVRYHQPEDPSPSYAGVVASIGETRYDHASGGGLERSLGLGVAPTSGSLLLIHRLSIDGILIHPLDSRGPRSAAVMISAGLVLPNLGSWRSAPLVWLDHVRLGAGHAWTRGTSAFGDGPRYTLGLESPPIPLRFTFAAIALRLEGQWTRLPRPRRGLALALVMQ